MVRLMLVLAPAAAFLSSIGISEVLSTFMRIFKASRKDSNSASKSKSKKKQKKNDSGGKTKMPWELALVMIAGIYFLLAFFALHCVWVCTKSIYYYCTVLTFNCF